MDSRSGPEMFLANMTQIGRHILHPTALGKKNVTCFLRAFIPSGITPMVFFRLTDDGENRTKPKPVRVRRRRPKTSFREPMPSCPCFGWETSFGGSFDLRNLGALL